MIPLQAVSRKPRFWALLFIIGGLCGATLDQLHVQGGVLSYAHPVLAGQAWWVAPNFGLASCAMYLVTLAWVGWAERARPVAPSRAELALDALWFVGAYAASVAAQKSPVTLATVYALLYLRRLLRREDALPQLGLGVCLALGGCLTEAVLAQIGLFRYAHPQVWTIPVWLPGIYLHGGPLAMATVRWMRR